VPDREIAESMTAIRAGQMEFVFATPERLENPDFVKALRQTEVDLFVIDEAHCLSEWGHDFRPAFLGLGGAITALGSPPVLALTATATERVVGDVIRQLQLERPEVVNLGVYRENLRYAVHHTAKESAKQQRLVKLLRESDGSGIVYVATVKHCDEVTRVLEAEGLQAAKYHGRLGAKVRRETQELFMSGALRAIVATNAFGMGIDKPDIRFVVHYDMPGSLEAYYQESGRAGRDGAPADCLLLYRLEDRRTHQYFMGGRYPGSDDILGVRDALARLGANAQAVSLAAIQGEATSVGKTRLRSVLAVMKEIGIVRELRGSQFRLVEKDVDAVRLEQIAREYQQRRDDDRRKLERMTMYAQSAACRWKLLLENFGEGETFDRCGNCDNCVDPPELKYQPPTSAVQVS
jgi:ATP-dependent DNA helicase RecQ